MEIARLSTASWRHRNVYYSNSTHMLSRDESRGIARSMAREAMSTGRPFEWFERLYSMASRGELVIPWADGEANHSLADLFSRAAQPVKPNGRALCVGCGYGDDAEWLASLGLQVTAFDIAPTAIDECRARFPESSVDYVVADLLAPPESWVGRFDLVVESNTIQVLPVDLRESALEVLVSFLTHGGSLYLLARLRDDDESPGDMPWPLTRDDLTIPIHDHRLIPVVLDDFVDPEEPSVRRVMACFRR